MINISFTELQEDIHKLLLERNLKISFAESCTGGLLQKLITDMSGSSNYFDGGFVTYSNRLKNKILDVQENTLVQFGAVSPECAKEMVCGVRRLTDADICVSVTGIAGPSGGSADKPVGLVWFGFYVNNKLWTTNKIFAGSRQEVREQSAHFAITTILKSLSIEE